MREMSKDELERYAPYHTFPEFWKGYDSYPAECPHTWRDSVMGQAFDRGAEMAMRRRLAAFRVRVVFPGR